MKSIWPFLLLLCAMSVHSQTITTVAGPAIKLTWAAPTQNTKGAALAGTTTYNLYQGACNPTATFSLVQTGIGGISAVVSAGIAPGVTYGFRVTAVNAAQPTPESAPSPTICAVVGATTTTPPVMPPPVTGGAAPNPPTAFAVITP